MGVTRLCLVGRLCAVGRLWNDKINDYACTTRAHTIESAKVQRIFGMCKFKRTKLFKIKQNYLSSAVPSPI